MNANRKSAALAAVAASSLIALATAATAAGAPSVIAMNQKVKNGEVSITYANIPKDGYLVLHASKTNGTVLGEVPLKAGDHRNIKVKINGTVPTGGKLWAELQPAKDSSKPFNDQGTPVEQSFKVL